MNTEEQCLKDLDDGTEMLKESPPLTAATKANFLHFPETSDSRRRVTLLAVAHQSDVSEFSASHSLFFLHFTSIDLPLSSSL